MDQQPDKRTSIMSELLGNPVFSFFAEKITDTLFDQLSGFISDQKEKAELKRKLRENFERYFKEGYQSLTISEEFDVLELNDYLIENLYTKVAICFLAGSSKECSYYRDSLIASSYTIAGASTKAKQQEVYAYVDSFLEVLKANFFSMVDAKDLFLVNQQSDQIEKAFKDYIQAQNEELQEFIKYHGSFAEYIDSLELKPSISHSTKESLSPNLLFHYLNPEIGFVRRDDQFKFLNGFLEKDARLLCLAITGYGGIGKSKLLYQYALELRHNLEWKTVILDRSLVDKLCGFTEWNYPKNLLLVIDYAAEKSKTLGEWIRAIQQSHSRPYKMRIILLERQGITKANEQTIYPLWYQQIAKASGNYLESIQYPDGNGFYELPRFNKEEMFQVMDMLPEAQSRLTQAEKEEVYNKILSFSGDYQDERFNTPLIALMLAHAHSHGKDLPDLEQLMSYVIRRNKKTWKRAFAAYEKKEGLVKALERSMVYATATGGCNLTRLPPPLDMDKELFINTLEMDGTKQLPALIAGDTQQDHQLEPLKPDILGEYFVLHYIDQNRGSEHCKKMIAACWKESEEFLFFLIRCVRSYLGKFSDNLVFEEPPILFQGADPFDQAVVLFGMTTLPETSLCQKALDVLKRLNQEHKESQLAEVFAMGLVNLSIEQEEPEARKSIDELKALSKQWPENSEIALVYAMGLFNLSNKQEELEALQATIAELKTLSKQWPENSEIALVYAKGLFNLSIEQEELEALQATIAELKTLSKQWPEILESVLMYAKKLADNLKKQNEPDALCAITKLEQLIQSLEALGK